MNTDKISEIKKLKEAQWIVSQYNYLCTTLNSGAKYIEYLELQNNLVLAGRSELFAEKQF